RLKFGFQTAFFKRRKLTNQSYIIINYLHKKQKLKNYIKKQKSWFYDWYYFHKKNGNVNV
ncbi:hypothetical protein, partial [Neisseria sp. HMSC064F03]|uniref:hypothetical protein n=1 Tax=Neisseria sp. HMSC064F03 TaxID=1715037 RepID=UPI001AEF373D